jgi:hypothetical protein
MSNFLRVVAWTMLVPTAVISYLLIHAILIAVGKFVAWLFQTSEIEKISEYFISPIVSAYVAYAFPLRMFPSDARLAPVVLSFILIAVFGVAIGFAMYSLARNSALAALFSAFVVILVSHTRISRLP